MRSDADIRISWPNTIALSGSMPENGDVQALQITPDSQRVIYLADQDIDEMVELFGAICGIGVISPR